MKPLKLTMSAVGSYAGKNVIDLSLIHIYFNVIYLLSGGNPTPVDATAGKTDLLVTWLYKLTVDKNLSLIHIWSPALRGLKC